MKKSRHSSNISSVVGVTGVGKSLVVTLDPFPRYPAHYYSLLMPSPESRKSSSEKIRFQSCTDKVQPVIINSTLVNSRKASYHGRRLIVVDTPGFDSTFGDDSTTLKEIVENLAIR